jgi:hypothetical protein
MSPPRRSCRRIRRVESSRRGVGDDRVWVLSGRGRGAGLCCSARRRAEDVLVQVERALGRTVRRPPCRPESFLVLLAPLRRALARSATGGAALSLGGAQDQSSSPRSRTLAVLLNTHTGRPRRVQKLDSSCKLVDSDGRAEFMNPPRLRVWATGPRPEPLKVCTPGILAHSPLSTLAWPGGEPEPGPSITGDSFSHPR